MQLPVPAAAVVATAAIATAVAAAAARRVSGVSGVVFLLVQCHFISQYWKNAFLGWAGKHIKLLLVIGYRWSLLLLLLP